ncbi:MAG: DMP19 family protein [Bacteroides sp.]|nr:DMP19 family protein [Bacteroides sp.]
MIEIKDSALQKAAASGMDEFIQLFTDKYKEVLGGDPDADNMHLLTGEQHALLSYRIFLDEVMTGGFCQLIQNGYGAYIFDNPFAKAMRVWGAKDFSRLIYKAKEVYDSNKEDLQRERTEEEFMAMYEDYEIFDDLEEEFIYMEELITTQIAEYVDDHIGLFAKIVK